MIQLENFAIRGAIAGAVFGLILFPLSASAEMETVEQSEIAHLTEIDNSAFAEYYEHPDLATLPFRSIYIEPVANDMPVRWIYSAFYRPEHIDALAAEFHEKLIAALAPTGMLTDEPDANTLVISTSVMFVSKYSEQSTGSHLARSLDQNRTRGNTVIEMTWRAGPGGEIVVALRDGFKPLIYDPVTDRTDRFTDVHDSFDMWAGDVAAFFGLSEQASLN